MIARGYIIRTEERDNTMTTLTEKELKRYWELVNNPQRTYAEYQEYLDLQAKLEGLYEGRD